MEKVEIEPVTVSITPSLELLKDIAIYAVEGGIGYWARATEFRWKESRVEAANRTGRPVELLAEGARQDLPFPVLTIMPEEDPDEFEETVVRPAHIRAGIQSLLQPGAKINSTIRESVMKALMEDDACYIDSEAADAIVQFGVLGELVYG